MIRLRHPRKAVRGRECGYMLLILMMAVAIITITMLSVAYNFKRMVQRDREVEMIHRGEQYERAVRLYYRKIGHYPSSIQQLESTNKLRFLRKRYKDPMAPDGEWKLVHLADLLNLNGSSLSKTAAAAASQADAKNGTGGANGTDTSLTGGDLGGSGTGGTGTGGAGTGGSGGLTGSGSSNSGGTSGSSGTTSGGTPGGTSGSAFGNSSGSAFGSSSGSSSGSACGSSGSTTSLGGSNNLANGQTLGGDIYGVVSKSRRAGMHSFGNKSRYSEWFFIYDPTFDRGQMLVGPFNPQMFFGQYAGGGAGGSSTTGTTGSGSSTGGQNNGSAFGSGSGSTFGSGSNSGTGSGSNSGSNNGTNNGTGSGTGTNGPTSTTNP